MTIIAISIGGFVGAILRYVVINFFKNLMLSTFPFGTFLVNVLGSFCLGVIIGLELKGFGNSLLSTGFVGAFTTFSTLQVEILELWDHQDRKIVISYAILSYLVGLLAAFTGYIISK